MPPREDDEGTPITSKTLLTWGVPIVTVAVALVSLVLYVASMKNDIDMVSRDVTDNIARILDVDKVSLARHEAQDREISELKGKTNTFEARLSEMNTRLGEAVVILRRLDERANKP